MSSKKSQASVEFLITYGWMLILILGIIGALMKYNVIGSESLGLKSETCTIYSSVNCLGAVWRKDSINLSVSNDAQTSLQINDILIKDKLNRFSFRWHWKPDEETVLCSDFSNINGQPKEYKNYICNDSDANCIENPLGEVCKSLMLNKSNDQGCPGRDNPDIVTNLSDCSATFPKTSVLIFTLKSADDLSNVKELDGIILINYSFSGSNLVNETHIAKGHIYIKKAG